MTNKKTIKAYANELSIILSTIKDDRKFTSNSTGIDGRVLKMLVNKRVISLVGRDKKRKVNVYKISMHQVKVIKDTFEAIHGGNCHTNL